MGKHFHYFITLIILSTTLSVAQRQAGDKYISPNFGPNFSIGYVKYFPPTYSSNNDLYPLLISLHGSGNQNWSISASNPDDTSQLYKVRDMGISHLIGIDPNFNLPFVVISPQSPFGDWDNVITAKNQNMHFEPGTLINEIVEKMKTLYRIDPKRVYIAGYSAGGDGAWNYILNYPDKVAAAITMCPTYTDKTKACVVADNKIGIWSFHGTYDGFPYQNSVDMVNMINNCNPKYPAKITLYEGDGHMIWDKTYNNSGYGIAPDNIYTWLAGFSKDGNVSNNSTSIVAPDNSKTTAISTIIPVQNLSGSYVITNRNSEKALDIDGGSKNSGAPLKQMELNGNFEQVWNFVDMGDKTYKIVSSQSDNVLDLRYGNTADGAIIQQYSDNGTDAQRWIIELVDNAYYKIISKASGKVLQVSESSTDNGATINQGTNSNSFNKQWKLTQENLITATINLNNKKGGNNDRSTLLTFDKNCQCFSVPVDESGYADLTLYDLTGKVFSKEYKTVMPGSNNISYAPNLNSFPKGIYYLNVNSSSINKTLKCLVD